MSDINTNTWIRVPKGRGKASDRKSSFSKVSDYAPSFRKASDWEDTNTKKVNFRKASDWEDTHTKKVYFRQASDWELSTGKDLLASKDDLWWGTLSLQKYLRYEDVKPYEYPSQIKEKWKDWIIANNVMPPSKEPIYKTVICQNKELYDKIKETNYLGKYNLSVIDKENDYEGKEYCVVKFNYSGLTFPSKIKFKEYMEVNEKILFLLYNIYNNSKITEKKLYYFYEKDKASTHSIEHKISRSSTKKKWSIMELFGYLRNYQLIMMKKIYSKIQNLCESETVFDKDIRIQEFLDIINVAEEAFKNWLEEKAFKKWLNDNKIDFHATDYESKKVEFKKYLVDNPVVNMYRIITEYETKLKYIYSMFMEYLRTIYIPEIVVKAFMNVAEYSKFNIFNTYYVRNLLLIKNKFFYQTTLNEDVFDFDGMRNSKVKQFKYKIKRINSIINDIDTFINYLDIDETSEKTKTLGCKLLSIKSEKYTEEIKKYMFYCNIHIDEAVFYVFPDINTYDSDIIVSPATILNENEGNNFCDIIEELPEKEGINTNKKTKIYGIGSLDEIFYKYRGTCPRKYESSDYLTIPSPISNFMLFYWSPFVNAYLTDKSINDENNNVLIWDNKFKIYTMSSRFLRNDNNPNRLKDLLTTHVYLGFIKITVSNGIRLIFVFIKSYYIELYDIYGSKLIYGNYSPFSFITSQEIPVLLSEDRHVRKLKYTGKTNKDYYLFLKELDDGETDYKNLFNTTIQLLSDSTKWRAPDHKELQSDGTGSGFYDPSNPYGVLQPLE